VNPSMFIAAIPDAARKLHPRTMVRNPVMFVVEVGAVLTTILLALDPTLFAAQITVWLWLTVLFANMAEAVAEGRGKAQAATLRAARKETMARRLFPDGTEEVVSGSQLLPGDRCVVEAGEIIPGDGEVVEGVASVDESAITGESAPVIRESGGDRSAVTGGTKVLSDRIVVLTNAPTEVKEIVAVDLPAARDQIETKELTEFAHLRAHVYRLIKRDLPALRAAASAPALAGEVFHDVSNEKEGAGK